MTLWAITMVRDEMDVLPYTLMHLINEGVDAMLIADNMSTDGTREWLAEFVEAAPIPVQLVDDTDVAYYQSRKMTAHYHAVSAAGADWVIPFDADEIWYDPTGVTLGETFAQFDGTERRGRRIDCMTAKLFNYFGTATDPVDEPNPAKRITYRDPNKAPMAKVAVRAGIDQLVIEQGNHSVHAYHEVRARPGLEIGHFPWRSPEQFERKVRNGADAYAAATELPLNQGDHWRQHGRILNEQGSAGLRAVYDKWYNDPPDLALECLPVPFRGAPQPSVADTEALLADVPSPGERIP